MSVDVYKAKVAREDIFLGTSTKSVKTSSSGTNRTVTELNASHIPLKNESGKYVEDLRWAVIADALGRVLRRIKVVIDEGADANDDELQVTVTSEFNGDAISATDDIGKSATVGNFSLSADGSQLTIEASGLSGNAIAVLSCEVGKTISGDTNTDVFCVAATVANNDIVLKFTDHGDGTAKDLTAYLGTSETATIHLYITYLTSA